LAREEWTEADSVSLPSTRPPPGSSTVAPPSVDDAESIRADLLANARYYDFFYVVGMAERLHPQAVRVGGDGPPAREAIRFRHDGDLVFSAGDISAIEWVEQKRSAEQLLEAPKRRFEITTAFLGLTGSTTPMPLYFAEEITQAQDSGEVKRDFLDVFHHRMVSFVYRIGVKYDLAREYAKDGSDPWSRRILALAGFDAWSPRKLKHVPQWRMLRLASLLASGVRSARTLELAIEDVCGEALERAHVDVDQFAGGWSGLDEDQRMSLGARNHALGMLSVLGVECYDLAGKAVISIGPLGPNFRRFLADGDMFPVVVELVSMLSSDPVKYELELRVANVDRPPFRLGVGDGGRVGVDSWLSSGADADSLTKIRVELPAELPDDPSAARFNYGWRSQPQRQ
jgi:type VI secretion system protein ImpH